MKKQRKPRTFTDEIRAAVLDAKARGWSRYQLSKAVVGWSQSNAADFTSGRLGIASAKLDDIAALLGLRVVVDLEVQRRTAEAWRSRAAPGTWRRGSSSARSSS